MPKKTKKEKIISQYRRKLELLQRFNLNNSDKLEKPNTNRPLITEKESLLEKTKNPPLIVEENQSLTKKYFFSDLKKSLLFSFLIISIEIVLSSLKVIK